MHTRHLSSHTQGCCSLRSTATIWVETEGERLYVTRATNEALKLFGYVEESEIISSEIEEVFEIVEYVNESNDYLLLRTMKNSKGPIWVNACAHISKNQQQWNLRDVTHQKLLTSFELPSPVTEHRDHDVYVLSITHFGIIEHVFPAPFMGLKVNDLIDRPLMKFVHPEDLKILCNGLSTMSKSMYASFTVRWQNGDDDSNEIKYEQVQVHAMISENNPVCVIRSPLATLGTEKSVSIRKAHHSDNNRDINRGLMWPFIGQLEVVNKIYLHCIDYFQDYWNYWHRYVIEHIEDSPNAKNWNSLLEAVYQDLEKSPLEAWSNCKNNVASFLVNLVTTWSAFATHE
ncbi:hypothetical protein K7432_013025 [Basidiobolus ranarum]|uniref:Uncharacterized protein n=1 Tax=Basidiobolus ranarum TaxID=34480 RepID=A0ABR2WJX8_9FUNG